MRIRRYRKLILSLTVAVVSILLFVSDSQALGAGRDYLDNNVRIINVKAVGDEEFRKSSDWVEEIEESIKRTSAFYEEQFGIKFELRTIGEWVSDNNIKSIQILLSRLKDKVGKSDNDLVIGFTRQIPSRVKCVFSRTKLGIALPFSDYVMVRVHRSGDQNYHRISLVLAHELGHVFGALHVKDSSSIMNVSVSNDSVFRFDADNEKIIRLSKLVDFNKGVTSINEANLDQLTGIYKDSLAVDFENASRHLLMGSIYDERGLIDEAILEYKEAVKLDRKDFESLIRLGIAYAGKGLLDDAIAEFNKAVRLDSVDGAAHVNLGLVLIKKGMLDEAVDQVKKAIEINNNNPEAHCILGGIYIQKRLFDEAIYECRQALRNRKMYSKAHYNMGIAYHKKLMYNNAIKEYKDAIEIEHNNIRARNNLSIAYYEQGLLNKAELEYIKLLQIDPVNEIALNNFEVVLLQKKERLKCEAVRKD